MEVYSYHKRILRNNKTARVAEKMAFCCRTEGSYIFHLADWVIFFHKLKFDAIFSAYVYFTGWF
jgi:hypothetical protein